MTIKKIIVIIFGIAVLFFVGKEFLTSEKSTLSQDVQLELLSKANLSNISNKEITKAASEESEKQADGYLANPKAKDCFDVLGYRYTGGRYNDELIRFRLRCPLKIVPGRQYPLIVWFHGKGESGDDNERQLAHLQYTLPFLVGEKSLDFFMLVTQCPKDNPYWDTSISQEGKGDAPITIAMEIFERMLAEYPIDRKRISTFGQCSGAIGSTELIKKYPKLISAVVYVSAMPPADFVMKDVTVSAFHCTGDTMVSIQAMREYVKIVNGAGGSAYLTEVNASSHDAWTEALSKCKVIAWMITQRKNNLISPPPGAILYPLTWYQVYVYFGVPLCCLLLLFLMPKSKRR